MVGANIKVDIPKDAESRVEIALEVIKHLPRDDLETLATPTLISQLMENDALYTKYYLKYKK